MLQQAQWPQAENLFQIALEYHQGFQCVYGQIENLNLLAIAADKQGHVQQALQQLDNALSLANQQNLHLFAIELLKTKLGMVDDAAQQQQINQQIATLIQLTKESPLTKP